MPVSVVGEQTPPEELLDVLPGEDAPDESLDNSTSADEIPEEISNAIKELAKEFAGRDRWIRRWEIQKVRKNRFFWRGNQRLIWNGQEGAYQITPYQGGSTTWTSDAADRPQYLDTTNIYQAYGRIVIAALTQNLPSVRFEPSDPDAPLDIQAASAAEKLRKVIERNNDMTSLQVGLGRLLWTDGRVVAWTHYVRDKQRFGTEEVNGEKVPAGQEVIEFFGVLECKVPITIQEFRNMPYVQISIEEDIVNLKAEFPDVADEITAGAAGAADDQYERIARLSVMQGVELLTQSGDSISHLVTKQRIWFRPSAFQALGDEAIRGKVLARFPDGCRAIFAGETLCELADENPDDALAICRPLPGDGQDTPALGDILISPQERLNDFLDIQGEGYEYGIPAIWYDQKTVDIKAMQEQQSLPAAKYPCTNPMPGQPLSNQFFIEPPATISADMQKYIADLVGPHSEFLCGAPPALFGGSMEDQKTASGYAMARDQAMGQMGIVWRPMKKFYAELMSQAVRCASKNRVNDVKTGSGINSVEISLSDLKGSILCFPDTDENFPESWTQKRQVVMQVITMAATNPPLAQQILSGPDNFRMLKQYIGLDELKIPGADSSSKQLWEIQQLLKSGPQAPMPVPNPQTGQPVVNPLNNQPLMTPPQSTVPIDPIYDNHAIEFQEVVTWINSESGRTAKITNPEGFANVRLHGIEHQKAMTAPPPPTKPPSESINFKDLPPAGQIQMAGEAGIKLGPQDVMPPQVSAPQGPNTLPAPAGNSGG